MPKKLGNVCPVCKAPAPHRRIRRYHYPESGLDNVVLVDSAVSIPCPNHGEIIHVPAERQLLRLLALMLLEQPGILSASEQRYLRVELELSQSALARLLGLRGHATIAERETGRSKLTWEADLFLRAVVARELYRRHTDDPASSPLSASQVTRLRRLLARFTDLVDRGARKPKRNLQLAVRGRTWDLAA